MNADSKNTETEQCTIPSVGQRLFDKGTKLVFTDDFKKRINDDENKDVLYYIQNDEFIVKDSKDGFVKIEGIAMWNWVTTDIFNVA